MNEMLSQPRELLFPSVSGVAFMDVRTDEEVIRIEARCTPTGGGCPYDFGQGKRGCVESVSRGSMAGWLICCG
ncbi:hypothetical protein ABT030_49520, partial [Streptomyces mirabilis]|uniref:hypothetical protein n=1 Tax=Streptomyces mirabilis TaxID=68239 RepID=UPI003326117B